MSISKQSSQFLRRSVLILKTRFYIIWMLPFLEYDLYLEKKNIYTLNSMADWLRVSWERKQPPSWKEAAGWFLLVGLVQASVLRDLETSADYAGQGPFLALGLLSLYPQEQILRAQWVTANGCYFFQLLWKKKCTVNIINCFAKTSENSEMKLLAINSVSNVAVNWSGSNIMCKGKMLVNTAIASNSSMGFQPVFSFRGWAMLQKM